MKLKDLLALGVFAGVSVAAAAAGRKVVDRPRKKLWYRVLRKPAQTPPDWVFGAVWPVLYGLGTYSAYRIWKKREQPGARGALALWGTQLAFNSAWTPLFFGMHRARIAMADLVLTFAALAAYTKRAARVDRPAAAMMAPYLAWLGFAATLNAGFIARNPKQLVG